MLKIRQVMRAVSALPFILASGCFPEAATEAAVSAQGMTAQSVPAASSLIGSSAAPNPSVLVTNKRGKAVTNATVTFTVTAGNGAITSAEVNTDRQGIASVGWTLGMQPGMNQLTATLGDLAPVMFEVTTTGGGPTSMGKANDGQSGPVGDPLPQPVAVVVRDVTGSPVAGAVVVFTALGGSGLTSLSETAAVVAADANGRAETPWTMGTVPGSYSLTAEVSGVPTQTFVATALVGPAYEIVKSGDAQSGPVNTNLPATIGITVRDRFQNLVSGVPVTFSPASGSSVSTPDDLTNSSGQASTQWKMPTVAGAVSLNVAAGPLSASFSATAQPGPAAKLEKMVSSDNQTGDAGQTLPQSISVTVRDQYDNALVGVPVSFAPAGGSVNPASAQTDVNGQANTVWTLGSVAGPTSLGASAVGIANGVIFNATVRAVADPCDARGTLTLGIPVSGNLANSQCSFPATRTKVDLWSLNLAGAPGFEIIETMDDANSPDAFMAMYAARYASEQVIATNDDMDPDNSNWNSRIRFIGGQGQALVGASYLRWSMNDPGSTYHLVANRWGGAVTACQEVYAGTGTNTNQILDNDDCPATTSPARTHSDRVYVMLRPGQTMTVTMNASAFDAKLDLENSGSVVVAADDNGNGGTNARLVYTAPASSTVVDRFAIFATSVGNNGGNYTLTIDISTPPAPSAMMRSSAATTGDVFGPGVVLPGTERKPRTLRQP